MTGAALHLEGVGLTRDGRDLLDGIHLAVEPDERWVVLGANGSGKTSLLAVAALRLHPSRGRVTVLGEELGRSDVRSLRRRVGFASQALADALRPDISARDVVMTAAKGALEPWWHHWDDDDRSAAMSCLDRVDLAPFAARSFGTLSSGERQRVLVARTLMGDPGLVLLDEPGAGLDLGARERLVADLGRIAADPATAPVVLVTHHLEEVPAGFTHALVLHAGRALASGELTETLTGPVLSGAFGLALEVRHHAGRWTATTTG
ncbi:MAG: ATP-binding cassette domain-containing protein [Acidimicrobiales bacterium]